MIDETIILFSYNSKSSRNSRAESPPPPPYLLLVLSLKPSNFLLPSFISFSFTTWILLPFFLPINARTSTPHLRWYSPSLLSFQSLPPRSHLLIFSFLSFLPLFTYFSSPFFLFLIFLPSLSFSPLLSSSSFCLLKSVTRTLTTFLFLSPNSEPLSLDLLFYLPKPTLSPPYPTPYPWVMTGMMKGFSSPFLPTIPLGGKYIV